MYHPIAFAKPVVEHWLEREIAQWVHYPTDRLAHTTTFVKPVVEHWLVGTGFKATAPSYIYLMMHSTHFNKSYMSLVNIFLRNIRNIFLITSRSNGQNKEEMFYLTLHSTHFIPWLYGTGPLRE